MGRLGKEEIEKILKGNVDERMEEIREPNKEEWENLEEKFGCEFGEDFKDFIGLMGKYSFPGDILGVGETSENDTIDSTYDYEIRYGNRESDMIPFYSIGNGDYFCFSSKQLPESPIYYIRHEDSSVEEEYGSFREWVLDLPDFLS